MIAKRRFDLELPDVEALWLEIKSHNNTLLLGTFYRPPNSGSLFWEQLQDMTDLVKSGNNAHVIYAGDFNADDRTNHGNMFKLFVEANNLHSHINEPTRITERSATCLDRIVSNIPHYVETAQVLDPLLHNDHCYVGITLRFSIPKSQSYSRLMWDYSRADYEGLREHIRSIDWNMICENFTDIDFAANQWSTTVLEAAKTFIPHTMVTIRPRDKPWYNNELRRCKRRVERLHKLAKRVRNDRAWATFRKTRNDYIQKCRDSEKRYEMNRRNDLQTCSFTTKECWKLYKSILGLTSDHMFPAMIDGGVVINDNEAKAELFNKLFLEQSQIDETGKSPPGDIPDYSYLSSIIDHIPVTLDDVKDQLSTLDTSKAYGPDGIGPKLLKELKHVLCDSIYKLFSSSIEHNKMPLCWKEAGDIPLVRGSTSPRVH